MPLADQWVSLADIAKRFGVSERTVLAVKGLPLRKITPKSTPGCYDSELREWLKGQPEGGPVLEEEEESPAGE